MAEKLNEASWAAFAKKQDLGDAALVKALSKLDKTDSKKPEDRQQALAEVIAQITKLIPALTKRKKELGDKPFEAAKAKLYALLEEAEKEQKQTRSQIKDNDADGDADESPAVLTTKLVAWVKQVQKGSQMHGMICTAGKNTSVMVAPKPISVPQRKLLMEAVDAKGGAKFIPAECLLENNAVTFVVEVSASGLAKRITAALLAQTGMRFKVRVRGNDGSEDTDEPVVDPKQTGTGSEADKQTALAMQKDKWAELFPQVSALVLAALKGMHPESTKLRAAIAFAQEKADEKGDYESALKALSSIQLLLKTTGKSTTGQEPSGSIPPESTKAPLQLMSDDVYNQVRSAWSGVRSRVKDDIEKLKSAILATYKDQPVINEVTKATSKLDHILKQLDERLLDVIDTLLAAKDKAEKKVLHDKARDILGQYQQTIERDKMLAQLDNNPFVPLAVQKALSSTVNLLVSKFK